MKLDKKIALLKKLIAEDEAFLKNPPQSVHMVEEISGTSERLMLMNRELDILLNDQIKGVHNGEEKIL